MVPIPGSKIFYDLGHETEVGFLKGKLICTSSAFTDKSSQFGAGEEK
jgi:hypothetical protein